MWEKVDIEFWPAFWYLKPWTHNIFIHTADISQMARCGVSHTRAWLNPPVSSHTAQLNVYTCIHPVNLRASADISTSRATKPSPVQWWEDPNKMYKNRTESYTNSVFVCASAVNTRACFRSHPPPNITRCKISPIKHMFLMKTSASYSTAKAWPAYVTANVKVCL